MFIRYDWFELYGLKLNFETLTLIVDFDFVLVIMQQRSYHVNLLCVPVHRTESIDAIYCLVWPCHQVCDQCAACYRPTVDTRPPTFGCRNLINVCRPNLVSRNRSKFNRTGNTRMFTHAASPPRLSVLWTAIYQFANNTDQSACLQVPVTLGKMHTYWEDGFVIIHVYTMVERI